MNYKITKFDEAKFDEDKFDGANKSVNQLMFGGKHARAKLVEAVGPKRTILRALA